MTDAFSSPQLLKNRRVREYLSRFASQNWDHVVKCTLLYGIQMLSLNQGAADVNKLTVKQLERLVVQGSAAVVVEDKIGDIARELNRVHGQLHGFEDDLLLQGRRTGGRARGADRRSRSRPRRGDDRRRDHRRGRQGRGRSEEWQDRERDEAAAGEDDGGEAWAGREARQRVVRAPRSRSCPRPGQRRVRKRIRHREALHTAYLVTALGKPQCHHRTLACTSHHPTATIRHTARLCYSPCTTLLALPAMPICCRFVGFSVWCVAPTHMRPWTTRRRLRLAPVRRICVYAHALYKVFS
jgi:hypothetical protein